MKLKLNLITTLLLSCTAFSQVGIGTDNPKATLDVVYDDASDAPAGIMAPRMTGDEIASKDNNYGSDQEGTVVYATSPVTIATSKTENITYPGYYYFDGNIWQAFKDPETAISATPFYLSGTTTDAGSNKEDAIGRTGIVGIGTTTPDTGSILDVSSTDKGLLVPRVSTVESVIAPVNGMMVYDQSLRCFRFYEKNDTWTDCLSTGAEQTVKTDCTSNETVGFTGCFTEGVAVPGTNKFVVRLVNNTLNQVTLTGFTASDLVLSGVSGVNVTGVALSPVTGIMPANGGVLILTFSLSGAPQSSGTLAGTFSKGVLTCGDTTGVNVGTELFINPAPSSLPVGCAYPFSSPNSGVTWSSTLPSVATVDPITGNVTAVAPGTTIIRASMCGGITAERTITVVTRIYSYSSSGAGTITSLPASGNGITHFVAEAYGAGGGASSRRLSGTYRAGAGGGGGAYTSKTYTISSGNISYYVGFRGEGGGPVANYASGNNGENSGVTYNSVSITAGGGKGGCRGAALDICGGTGGEATGGDINLNGYSSTNYAGAGAAGPIGGAWQYNYSGPNGVQGNAPGGGGSSSNANTTGAPIPTNSKGGNGQNGRVIITLVCP